jgi:hypothetical protein
VDENYDSDLDVREPEAGAPEAPQAATESPDVRKLRQENRSLRERLRRSEVEAKHGAEVAGLIPPSLPLDEWEDYAAKLADFRQAPAPAPTESETVDAPSEERQATEAKLAAVVAPQATGTPQEILSAKEIGDLMKADPAAGLRAAQAKYGNP